MQNPIVFGLAALVILCTPGPTNTLLATAGGCLGLRRSLVLIPAEGLGYLIALLGWGLVAGPLVAHTPAISIGLRMALGAYLMVTALELWRRTGRSDSGMNPVISPRRVFITTLCNPKAMLLAFAVIPFERPDAWLYVTGFLCLAATVALGWIGAGTGLGQAARSHGRSALVPKAGAAVLGTFALALLASPLIA